MQYLESWRAPNGGPVLLLHVAVLAIFDKYAQVNGSSLESGGILLGYAREPHLEILEATEPSKWDRRLRYFFDRNWRGHRDVALRRNAESNGLVRYLGEWHTHPEDHPVPSFTDTSGWLKLARERDDKHPVLGIIVGRKSLHVELIYSDASRLYLAPAE